MDDEPCQEFRVWLVTKVECLWPVLNHWPNDRLCSQRVTDCHLGLSRVLAFHEC